MSLFAKDLTERAQKIGFILKDLVIWHKPIFVPSSGNKNLTDRYEHVIFLTKNKRNYYFNAEALSDVNDYLEFPNNSPLNIWRIHRRIGNIGKKILVVDKGMQIEHTAVYPDELVKRIIVLCSKKNDLILDPFSGSGTTLSTANNLGRRWIGYELNSSFNRLVEWRMKSIS